MEFIKKCFRKIKSNPKLFFSYLKLSFFYAFELIKNKLAYWIILINRKKYCEKKIWIISERKDEACDNGYFLFKYLRECHPEINVYYCISKKSKQYKNVSSYGNVINYGSIANYIYAYIADVRLSTMYNCPAPQLFGSSLFRSKIKHKVNSYRKKNGKNNQIVIFLQHGITKDYIDWLLNYDNQSNITDYIITGADKEKQFMIKNYNYPETNILCVGFCRWDNLYTKKTSDKYILVVPTWRNYVEEEIRELASINFMSKKPKNSTLKRFLNTEYYKNIKSLLLELSNDSRIKLGGYNVVLYLHPNFQKFSSAFAEIKFPNVIIKTKSNSSLCNLIRDAKILITDFSSVAFDAAFASVPIVYYQYDAKKFYSSHYKKGYFSYYDDGFGRVTNSINQLINEITSIINGGCVMENVYKKRVASFFKFIDHNNSKRTFDVIMKLLNK